MASKSRRGRGKYSPPSKKRKRRQISTITATQQQAIAQTYKPAAPSKVAVPLVEEPTPTIAHYPHMTAELRRIGMLAGIMITVLIILSLVLH